MVIRKNVNDLTANEKKQYVDGVKALKAKPLNDPKYPGVTNAYDKYVYIHNATQFHPGDQFPDPTAAHRGPAFLPWHRKFLLDFEKDIQQVLGNPNFGLPYWDWAADSTLTDPTTATIWQNDFMGGNGNPVTMGPFRQGQWATWLPGSTSGNLIRQFGQDPNASTLPTFSDVQYALAIPTYDSSPWNATSSMGNKGRSSFRNTLEGWVDWKANIKQKRQPQLHNRIHAWVGGSMSPLTSPNDPVFFLHHCNVDRIWAMWQAKYPNSHYLPTVGGQQGQNFEDPMWPWDTDPDITVPADMILYQDKYQYQIDSLVICHRGAGNPSSLWYNSFFDEILWDTDKSINGKTSDSPALAAFDGKLFCVHQGYNDSSSLWYNYFDGSSWSGDKPISGSSTAYPPALAAFKEKLLFCVHQGASDDGSLWYATTEDGFSWSGDKPMSGKLTGSPALAEFSGKLYCVHQGYRGSNSLWYNFYTEGSGWSGDKPISGSSTAYPPALAAFKEKLFCVHQGASNDGSLWYNYYTEKLGWSGDKPVRGGKLTGSPTLAVFNGKLFCIHQGYEDSTSLWYNYYTEKSGWSGDQPIPNSTGLAPKAAVFPVVFG